MAFTTRQDFLDVPGGRLYYEVEGAGHALTLLHAALAHLRMWDAQVRAFAERYRVIRYDCRGYGRTSTEDVAFSNRDDLRALLTTWASSGPICSASRGAP
jgi:pimeloyl-ACP methyl ester carboxylesterase